MQLQLVLQAGDTEVQSSHACQQGPCSPTSLGPQELQTTAGPRESQDGLIDTSGHRQQNFRAEVTYWAWVRVNVWVRGWGEAEVVQLSGTLAVTQASLMWALEELLANPSGRRKIATDGNCQQGTNSKNRGIHDRNYEREKEKKHFQCTRFIFSVKGKPVIESPNEQLH